MTVAADQSRAASTLEEQGRDIAPAVEGRAAIVIVGNDPSAGGRVALAIARAESRRRRVAVVDLAGELPALQALLPADAVYGLVDGVQYGVSLGHMAYPVEPSGRLCIVPSGAQPLDHAALLRSACWRAMMRTFRDAGTLVLLVVSSDLPELDTLQRATDGVILIGDTRFTDAQRVLACVDTHVPSAPPVPAPPQRTMPAGPSRDMKRMPRRHIVWLALAAAAVIFTVAYRLARPPVPTRHLAAVVEQDGAFSGSPATAAPTYGATPERPGIVVANPTDSSLAAAYAVALVTFNTAPAAQAQLQKANERRLPAVTFSHLTFGVDSARWYRVSTGAYPTRASADSLLAALRQRGILAPSAGRVVRAPFAIRMQANVALADAHALASAYRARGIPVYALRQDDGTLTLYAGAFETPAQAAMLLSALSANGEHAAVVYRTGRVL